jgi:hypothetical protein
MLKAMGKRVESLHPAWAAGLSAFVRGAPEQRCVIFVHFDEVDQALDPEGGERHDALVANPIKLDDAAPAVLAPLALTVFPDAEASPPNFHRLRSVR